MKKPLRSTVGYTVFLFCAVLLGTEIGLRLYFDDPLYRGGGYVSISPNPFQNQDGFWLYQPDSVIRQVAVYGFPTPRFLPQSRYTVEYDCQFTTNRFGLQGRNDQYIESRPTVLVLGDSFTEGRGGCPWMDRIIDQYGEFNILNGGLQITGIESFLRLYEHLVAQGVNIAKIIVIAIADDFKRTPVEWSQPVIDCLAFYGSCDQKWMWQPLLDNQTHEDLINQAMARESIRHGDKSQREILRLWIGRNSFLYTFLTANFQFYFGSTEYREGNPSVGPTPNNIEALEKLRSVDKGLEFILVPQRDEVAMRRPNIDTLETRDLLSQMKIKFTSCNLEQGDYLPNDPHPNAGGYSKLAACLQQQLDSIDLPRRALQTVR